MRILIVSDTHGINGPLRAVILKEKPDMLIHLGDSEYNQAEIAGWAGSPKTPCIFVRGNCDTTSYVPELVRNDAVFTLKGHKIFCTHGHRHKVNYGLLTLSLTAQEEGCDIVMFGHTHVPYDSFGDSISEFSRFYESAFGEGPSGPRILNPGSLSLPRGGSSRGYMILEMEDDGRYDVKYCYA
jgi:putative phosphoesterase